MTSEYKYLTLLQQQLFFGTIEVSFLIATRKSIFQEKQNDIAIDKSTFILLCTFMFGWIMVFNATFSNISVISFLLVEETGVPGENHRPVASQ